MTRLINEQQVISGIHLGRTLVLPPFFINLSKRDLRAILFS